ncbi:hypothetical protein ACS0PU_002546 [Formica fusca]
MNRAIYDLAAAFRDYRLLKQYGDTILLHRYNRIARENLIKSIIYTSTISQLHFEIAVFLINMETRYYRIDTVTRGNVLIKQ